MSGHTIGGAGGGACVPGSAASFYDHRQLQPVFGVQTGGRAGPAGTGMAPRSRQVNWLPASMFGVADAVNATGVDLIANDRLAHA